MVSISRGNRHHVNQRCQSAASAWTARGIQYNPPAALTAAAMPVGIVDHRCLITLHIFICPSSVASISMYIQSWRMRVWSSQSNTFPLITDIVSCIFWPEFTSRRQE
eukprot:5281981-Pleurochrysis_carterae.AAC.1